MFQTDFDRQIELMDNQCVAEPDDNPQLEREVHEPANEADEPEDGCRSVRFEEGNGGGKMERKCAPGSSRHFIQNQ